MIKLETTEKGIVLNNFVEVPESIVGKLRHTMQGYHLKVFKDKFPYLDKVLFTQNDQYTVQFKTVPLQNENIDNIKSLANIFKDACDLILVYETSLEVLANVASDAKHLFTEGPED